MFLGIFSDFEKNHKHCELDIPRMDVTNPGQFFSGFTVVPRLVNRLSYVSRGKKILCAVLETRQLLIGQPTGPQVKICM